MGANESRLNSDDLGPKQGYHVIRVAQRSPAQYAGFEPFFDFCVGINGQPLADLGVDILNENFSNAKPTKASWSLVEENEGRTIIINTWNSKHQEYRDVSITPSRKWSENNSQGNAQPSLLGLTLRLCNPLETISHVWHVLDVIEGSPADSAGLVPYGDYIIGWTQGPLRSEHDFFQLIEQYINHNLSLYVYNSDYDHTREVVIVPNRDWGGEGILGCGMGYGLLHRIPQPRKQWDDVVPEGQNQEYLSIETPSLSHSDVSTAPVSYNVMQEPISTDYGVTLNMHEEEEE